MAKYAKEVVKQAQAWLGKNEADGSHKEIIDIYNAHKPLARGYKVKYTDAWCATTVSAIAIKLGYTDIIPTECSCQKMIELLSKKGIFVENDAYVPEAGNIIFYDWDDSGVGDNKGWSDHVGIVESCDGANIVVIEGNLNNKVDRRTIKVNAKTIRGYGAPNYDTEPVVKPQANKKSIEEVARDVINGKYGNGTARKQAIEAEGYNYAEVQAKVNALLKGTVAKPTVLYFPKYTGQTNSIVTALNSLKITSSFTYRKKIAAKNNIKLYVGSAKQNTQMLNLLKQGKLIKP